MISDQTTEALRSAVELMWLSSELVNAGKLQTVQQIIVWQRSAVEQVDFRARPTKHKYGA